MTQLSLSDKQLFSLINEGSEEAFESLFNRYVPKLIVFALKLTQNQPQAEGIVQETFLQIWLGRDQLEAVENPSAWIYRIAANHCYKLLRRKVLAESSSPAILQDDLHHTINLNELNGLVKEAVAQLPEQRRKIYQLSRDGAMTIPQIATQLQLSPNTVKNTLVSSLKFIREYLQLRGYLLPAVLLLYYSK